jgi:single-strand DNA-binding protein
MTRRLSVNSINLIGRLARDPQLRELSQGAYVCDLRLAVDRMGRGRDTGYIDVAVFGSPGEAAARVLAKGWLVSVHGELAYREWRAGDGGRRSAHSIVGNVDSLVAPRRDGVGASSADVAEDAADPQSEQVPF